MRVRGGGDRWIRVFAASSSVILAANHNDIMSVE